MKKLNILALLLSGSATSLMATGTAGCDGAAGSGCGAWWNNYTLGVATDGAFAQSTGVGLSYTANYTSVSASQSPLEAVFPWTASSNQALSTSNASDAGLAALGLAVPNNLVTTTSNSSTSQPLGNFGALMFAPTVSVNNVASTVSTNTSVSTSLTVYAQTAGSYSNYLAQVYGATYGTRTYVGQADLITPEPGTYIPVGVGLLLIGSYARRRRAAK